VFLAARGDRCCGGSASPLGRRFECFGYGCSFFASVGFQSFLEKVLVEGAAFGESLQLFDFAEKFGVYGDAEVVFH